MLWPQFSAVFSASDQQMGEKSLMRYLLSSGLSFKARCNPNRFIHAILECCVARRGLDISSSRSSDEDESTCDGLGDARDVRDEVDTSDRDDPSDDHKASSGGAGFEVGADDGDAAFIQKVADKLTRGRKVTKQTGIDMAKKREFMEHIIECTDPNGIYIALYREELDKVGRQILERLHQYNKRGKGKRFGSAPLKGWPMDDVAELLRLMHTDHCKVSPCDLCHPMLKGSISGKSDVPGTDDIAELIRLYDACCKEPRPPRRQSIHCSIPKARRPLMKQW